MKKFVKTHKVNKLLISRQKLIEEQRVRKLFSILDRDMYNSFCSPNEPDDYGLRSLWRNISMSSQKSDCSSTISKEDLGFTESVLRTFTSPAYAYMESPFSNAVVSPLSDSFQLPDEYLHGLCRTKSLPKIEFQKFPTDLVSLNFKCELF